MAVKSSWPLQLFLISVLAACSGTAVDSRQDPGLIGTIGGVFGGGFEKDVEERKRRVEDAQDANLTVDEEVSGLEEQLRDSEAELASLEGELSKLRRRTEELRAGTGQHRSELSAQRAALADLQSKISRTEEQLETAAEARLDMDPVMVEANVQALQERLERLKEEAEVYESVLIDSLK